MTDESAQSRNILVSPMPCIEQPGSHTVFRSELGGRNSEHLVAAARGMRVITKSAVSLPPFSGPYTDLHAAIVPML